MKLAHATLSGRTQSLVNAPLQLRAKREATEKLKRDRWPNVRWYSVPCPLAGDLSNLPIDDDSSSFHRSHATREDFPVDR